MTDLKKAFSDCCKCTGSGLSGSLISHVGCLTIPSLAGLLGGSISHSFIATAMYITSPVIAVSTIYVIDKIKDQPSSVPKLAGSAILAFGMAAGINNYIGHGNHELHGHNQSIKQSEEDAATQRMKDLMQGDMCINPSI